MGGRLPSATAALVVAFALALPAAAPAAGIPPGSRAGGLHTAWRDPQAVRTVFFVSGMTCRACTMLLDRRLAATDGISWARFNFPLRLLVAYHDQRRISTGAIRDMVKETGLGIEMMESYPAAGYAPDKRVRVANWKSDAISLFEARELPRRFAATLKRNMLEEGDPEYTQVITEIVGEETRRRILSKVAAAAGYATGPPETSLPTVLARDFYYPEEALKPTPAEAGIARYLKEKVLLGDEGEEGRARFDAWLHDLWKDLRLDFRPEYFEPGIDLLAK